MKVIINKIELDKMISNSASYAEKKDLSSIISHILFCAKDGILQVKATDYELGLNYKNKNVKIEQEGFATANAKKIGDIVKSMKDGDITLETKENFIIIKQKSSKYKLPMFNYEDFPAFPTNENMSKFDINSLIFIRALKKIFPCIDTNNVNYAMNGALIDVRDDYINLVATDAKRLALYKLNVKINDKKGQIILPKKSIAEMQKLFSDDVEIYYNDEILIITNSEFEFFTKLINRKFPDYEKIVPNSFEKIVEIPRDKMVEGIKSISMLCEMSKITIDATKIKFESISEIQDEANNEIDVDLNLENEISFVVKSRNLMDFLTNVDEDKFTLKFKNPDVMFVVESNNFMTILVPKRA